MVCLNLSNEICFLTKFEKDLNVMIGLQKEMCTCHCFSDVLKYHIVHGTLYSRGMHTGTFHTLEEADRLRIYESFFGL